MIPTINNSKKKRLDKRNGNAHGAAPQSRSLEAHTTGRIYRYKMHPCKNATEYVLELKIRSASVCRKKRAYNMMSISSFSTAVHPQGQKAATPLLLPQVPR